MSNTFPELRENQARIQRLAAIICGGLVVLLLWASFYTLDVVSIAQGEIVPGDKVQSVQHLEGGVMREVMVKVGDTVTAGQTLAELESTSSGATVAELNLRIESLKLDIVRIQAELNGDQVLVIPKSAAC